MHSFCYASRYISCLSCILTNSHEPFQKEKKQINTSGSGRPLNPEISPIVRWTWTAHEQNKSGRTSLGWTGFWPSAAKKNLGQWHVGPSWRQPRPRQPIKSNHHGTAPVRHASSGTISRPPPTPGLCLVSSRDREKLHVHHSTAALSFFYSFSYLPEHSIPSP